MLQLMIFCFLTIYSCFKLGVCVCLCQHCYPEKYNVQELTSGKLLAQTFNVCLFKIINIYFCILNEACIVFTELNNE